MIRKKSAKEVQEDKLEVLSLAFFMHSFMTLILLSLLTLLFSCKKENVENPLIGVWQAGTYYHRHIDEYRKLDVESTSQDVMDYRYSNIGYKTITLRDDGSVELNINDVYLSSDEDSEIYMGTYTR